MASGGLYVRVLNRAGTVMGDGPLAEILAAQVTDQLDRGGSFSLTIPATDPRASLLVQGYEVQIHHETEGLVFRGIVESLVWEVRD